MEFFPYNKGKIAVKLTEHQNSAVSKAYWEIVKIIDRKYRF